MRTLPVGEHALLLEARDPAELRALHAHVHALHADGQLPPGIDIVPGACSLLLDGLTDPQGLAQAALRWTLPTVAGSLGATVDLNVVYDGADLPAVAERWGLDLAAAVRRHAEVEYTVAFIGFAPGFAYLNGLPDALAVPRRSTPRPRVPAGAVALAGTYTGMYPRPSPGGWQLIGHTDALLWSTTRNPPALLAPGDRVRIRAQR